MVTPVPPQLVPVTAQQDPVRSRPAVPPVMPVTDAAAEAAITLDRRRPQESAEDFQKRWQVRRQRVVRNKSVPETEPEAVALYTEDASAGEPAQQGQRIDISI